MSDKSVPSKPSVYGVTRKQENLVCQLRAITATADCATRAGSALDELGYLLKGAPPSPALWPVATVSEFAHKTSAYPHHLCSTPRTATILCSCTKRQHRDSRLQRY